MYKKIVFLVLIIVAIVGCSKVDSKKIVIYTSVDQVYSSKIFNEFEKKSGIKVYPVYDTEASKAIGLEKRLISEKDHPRADIFWNSEPIRTIRLSKIGLFESYSDENLPTYKSDLYHDKDGLWYGLGKRKRVIIVNTDLLSQDDYPRSFDSLWSENYKNKVAISSPYIGTAATHFAALYNKLGEDNFKRLLFNMKKVNIKYLAGNSVVKDAVGSGKYHIGITDSDDVLNGLNKKLPIDIIYYNQDKDGTFDIYGTVAMLKKSPNKKEARVFMKFLLTKNMEKKLIKMNAVQFSVFENNDTKEPKGWVGDATKMLEGLKNSKKLMEEIL